MWTKKIIVSKHVKERFEERRITFSQKKISIEQQIKHDLRPLNVRKKEKLNDLEYKVITKQGKVYIIKDLSRENKVIVKTVYKIDLKKELIMEERYYVN